MKQELGRKTCTARDLLKNTTALFGIRAGRRALYEYGPYGNILRMEGMPQRTIRSGSPANTLMTN
ncbi:hypothetical protein [uncultured Akkermansia sp.]|uniref:hypothetical protein n=1 Tax=uncultured Akkermansia sp. TaxID=512294 RepID=UPI0026396195|nr:hypothetical protein [uncultured Akkermansia sp.]